MCAVNDRKRSEYDAQIANLNTECEVEESKLLDLDESKGELQQLVDEAQCAINNLGNCDFGGDKIISSVITSQKGYQERIDYYDEYIIKCKEAIEAINEEIDKITKLRDALPTDCGSCSECNPPAPMMVQSLVK